MKGIYILVGTSSKDDNSGVGLKIRNQIKSFNNSGIDTDEVVLPISRNPLLSILYRLPFMNVYPVWSYRDAFNDVDCIYMRRPFVMNGAMRRILAQIKRNNPKVRIVVEIPTYPYDAEYGTYKFKSLLIAKDKYNRNRMKGLIDRFAVLSDDKTVFGVPAIKIMNGIDVNAVHKRVPVKDASGALNVCAVAAFKEWHGYERFIEGLRDYYSNGGSKNIICHFVGDGSELPLYKSLVAKYNLDDHFIFYGHLEGEELDEIYNTCSLSLGSFGMYKIGISLSCNLKSREAVARGIPQVTGCPTDIFEKDKYRYYLEFPNDTSTVDIQKIIDFCESIYSEGEDIVIEKIRQYAFENVSMDIAMKRVIDYFKE